MRIATAIGIIAGFLFPMIGAASETPTATDVRTVVGALVAINSSTISILPPPANRAAPTSRPAVETFPIDAATAVHRQLIRADGAHFVDWDFGRIRIGERVALRIAGGRLVAVDMLAAPPIVGRIISVSDSLIEVSQAAGRPGAPYRVSKLSIDKSSVSISRRWFDRAPSEAAALSDLKPGAGATVLEQDGNAVVVHIMPPKPLAGTIVRFSEGGIWVRPTSARGEPFDFLFATDSANTKFYNEFEGDKLVEGKQAQISEGALVLVISADGKFANAVAFAHPTVRGVVSHVADSSITVSCKDTHGITERIFTFDEKTRILLGHETNSVKEANGKTVHFFKYVPDGKPGDFRTGEKVSVNAMDGRIWSVLVTPLLPSTRPAGNHPTDGANAR